MELMGTCAEKLKKRIQGPIPERILGKMTVAVSARRKRYQVSVQDLESDRNTSLRASSSPPDRQGAAVSEREARRHPPGRQTLQHPAGRERSDQAVRLWHQRTPRRLQGQNPQRRLRRLHGGERTFARFPLLTEGESESETHHCGISLLLSSCSLRE